MYKRQEYYKHTDGDGTVHYFVYDSTKKKWKEETGLDLELILKTGDSDIAYVIKDKEENCLNFMTAGYLRSISDRHGNTLSLKYTNLRIASIADGAGRMTTLTYDTDSAGKANHLIKVTGPDQKSKTFAYTNGCLTSITDIDNSKTTYTSVSYTHLASAINPVALIRENIIDIVILIVFSLIVWIYAATKQRISRKEGISMVCMYLIYAGYIIWRSLLWACSWSDVDNSIV